MLIKTTKMKIKMENRFTYKLEVENRPENRRSTTTTGAVAGEKREERRVWRILVKSKKEMRRKGKIFIEGLKTPKTSDLVGRVATPDWTGTKCLSLHH